LLASGRKIFPAHVAPPHASRPVAVFYLFHIRCSGHGVYIIDFIEDGYYYDDQQSESLSEHVLESRRSRLSSYHDPNMRGTSVLTGSQILCSHTASFGFIPVCCSSFAAASASPQALSTLSPSNPATCSSVTVSRSTRRAIRFGHLEVFCVTSVLMVARRI
jgi:hypothetical protein